MKMKKLIKVLFIVGSFFSSVLTIQLSSCIEYEGMKTCDCTEGESPSATCIGKDLDTIPHDLHTQLTSLDLSYNSIFILDNVGFYPQLRTFTLNHNNLTKIAEQCFENNNVLQRLDLSHNSLSSLDVDTFLGLHSVVEIDLAHNLISQIKEDSFSHMSNLKTLDLSANMLMELNSQTFSFNIGQTLHTLILSDNHFKYFPRQALSDLSNLRILDVGKNDLHELGDYVFSDLKFLTHIKMNECGLQILGVNTFAGLEFLECLDISENRFTEVPEEALTLPSLETLYIGGNSINVLTSNNFKRLSRLENFYMNDCHDESLTLEEGVFKHNPDLVNLNISNCNLKNPDESVNIRHLHKLQHVNLHGNLLTTLHKEFLPIFDIQSVELSGCPLDCDCHLHWLRVLADVQPDLIHGARCVDGEDFVDFMSRDEQDFTCTETNLIIICSIAGAIIGLICISGIAFYIWKNPQCRRRVCDCRFRMSSDNSFFRSPFGKKKSSKLRLSQNFTGKQDIQVVQNNIENNGKFLELGGLDSVEEEEEDESSPIYDTVPEDNHNYPDVKISSI